MSIEFDNNASATLSVEAAGGTPGPEDTEIVLQAGEGALFPPVTTVSGDFFYCTMEDTSGNIEITKCTDVDTDTLTVARGQENTSSLTFAVGSKVELRTTAATFAEFIQRTGATMTGTLNMDGQVIEDPVLTNTGSGSLLGFSMRGSDDGSANELIVPSSGGAPTIGDAPASAIVTQAYGVATYVPLTRTLTGGEGLAAIGDLSANRTIDLDISELTTKLGAAVLADDQFLVYDTTAEAHKVIEYRDAGIPVVTATTNTITPTDDDTNAMYVCTHAAGPISFVLNDDIGQVGNVIIIQQADATQQVTVTGTATVNAAVPNKRTAVEWSVAVLVCTSDVTTHQWAMYGDIE